MEAYQSMHWSGRQGESHGFGGGEVLLLESLEYSHPFKKTLSPLLNMTEKAFPPFVLLSFFHIQVTNSIQIVQFVLVFIIRQHHFFSISFSPLTE